MKSTGPQLYNKSWVHGLLAINSIKSLPLKTISLQLATRWNNLTKKWASHQQESKIQNNYVVNVSPGGSGACGHKGDASEFKGVSSHKVGAMVWLGTSGNKGAQGHEQAQGCDWVWGYKQAQGNEITSAVNTPTTLPRRSLLPCQNFRGKSQ